MRCPEIAVLILNWNGKQNTLNCLASLAAAHQKPPFSPVVIDNGSTDDSVEAIHAAYPKIPILKTGKNLGYAGGNNVGLRWALGKSFEWILLLNNDTVIAPDFIEQLLLATQAQPRARILGAKIYRIDTPNQLDHLGGFWNPKIAEFVSPASNQYDDERFETMQSVDYVSGCGLFIHRSVLEIIGLFEESFFLLWEETDLCTRAKHAGFEIWTAPKAKLWHKVSASFTGGKPHMQYFWWRNRLLWISRNCARVEKQRLYAKVLFSEMAQCAKLALLKSALHGFLRICGKKPSALRLEKAKCYRASCRGILDYFLGNFGNCPKKYIKNSIQ